MIICHTNCLPVKIFKVKCLNMWRLTVLLCNLYTARLIYIGRTFKSKLYEYEGVDTVT